MPSLKLRSSFIHFTLPILGWTLVSPVQAEFVQDSKLRLDLRNYYFNRDFREGTGQSKREEWAQGFLLRLDSGYTEGHLGFGLDATAMLGFKLDSGPRRAGTGLLPVDSDGHAADEYSKLALAGKFKFSHSELKVGELLLPVLPTLKPNDGRLFPQSFEGGLLSSREIQGLTLTAGRLNKVKQRNSTDHSPLSLSSYNRRFQGHGATAKHFDLAGLDYQFSRQLLGRYHLAQLDDIYRQQVFNLVASGPLAAGTWNTDLRYSLMSDYADAKGGKIDNRALQGLLGYSLHGHTLGLAYQRMYGDTGYAYIHGTDANLINLSTLGEFGNARERSWALRYGYDFSAVGIPGLSVHSRYISGSHAKITGSHKTGRERELDNEVRYTLQSGPLKDLGVRLRTAAYRSNYTKNFPRNTDDVRLMLNYSWVIR